MNVVFSVPQSLVPIRESPHLRPSTSRQGTIENSPGILFLGIVSPTFLESREGRMKFCSIISIRTFIFLLYPHFFSRPWRD
jgi:hypothetical protein